MSYDYSRKGRRYRRGDHERLVWFLLLLAASVTVACVVFVVRH